MVAFDEDGRFWSQRLHIVLTNELTGEDLRFDIREYPEAASRTKVLFWNEHEKAMEVQETSDFSARLAYPWRVENLKKPGVQLQDFYLI